MAQLGRRVEMAVVRSDDNLPFARVLEHKWQVVIRLAGHIHAVVRQRLIAQWRASIADHAAAEAGLHSGLELELQP